MELNDIDLIEYPVFDFNIVDMCLLFNKVGLIIFKFFWFIWGFCNQI